MDHGSSAESASCPLQSELSRVQPPVRDTPAESSPPPAPVLPPARDTPEELASYSPARDPSPVASPGIIEDDLMAWRALRAEQDREYQESLQTDQEKESNRLLAREREEALADLRERLEERLVTKYCMDVSGQGKQIKLTLPNGKTLSSHFLQGTEIKVLYQYVFVKSDIDLPFGVFTLFPRSMLDFKSDGLVEDIRDSVLAVETGACDEGDSKLFNPLDYIEEDGSEESEVERILRKAKEDREVYVESMDTTRGGLCHTVVRSKIFDSIIALYSGQYVESLLHEHPFTVRFREEIGIDLGGVCRDMFQPSLKTCIRECLMGTLCWLLW